ncbi:MAG TPA: hypothetical protein VIH22_16905 [Cyclobacteriaceae bacterium]
MKSNQLRHSNLLKVITATLALTAGGFLPGCDDDDPGKEDTPELITKATLTFTPSGGGSLIVATATDPDGEGVLDIEVDGPINLAPNTSYNLAIALINELTDPTDPEYNITSEVEEEGDEHMFFFGWTNDVFSDPAGNGNIDNRDDDVNYEDEDVNGLPLGLETSWTTGAVSSGTFRIVLKHQPDLKSASSTSSTGESDLDIGFTINIQ